MDRLLGELNKNQREAVTHDAPVLQVLAPPGSGKTKTLTARVAYLISCKGIQPHNMIVCTFTKKAAREMKERIIGLMGSEENDYKEGKRLANRLIMGTFHSVARQFLAIHGKKIGIPKGFGIADTSDTKDLLKRIAKRRSSQMDAGTLRSRISSQKARSITPAEYKAKHKQHQDQEFASIYAEYEELLATSNLLDYDDLLLRCVDLLRRHPDCVEHIEAVLIDEFQDTNQVQLDLMRLFAQRRRHVTIVGDPDQSIYGFRNAEIENLNRMTKIYTGTCRVNLEENYRSSGLILAAASEVIEQDTSRPSKQLQPTHGRGERPVLRKVATAKDEAAWIVSEIVRVIGMTGQLLCNEDFAILVRSAYLSLPIEQALGKAGVAYRMVGGHKFFDRAEIKLVLDYMRVVNQPQHTDALARIVNVPPRKVGDTTIKGLLEEADAQKVPLWRIVLDTAQGIKKPKTKISTQAEKGLQAFVKIILDARKKMFGSEQVSVTDLLEHVIKRGNLKEYLKTKHQEDHKSRLENVEELIAQASTMSQLSSEEEEAIKEHLSSTQEADQGESSETKEKLEDFLANIALATDTQKNDDEEGEPTPRITISTIHAAKGLEWPVVFVPATFEGSIPHSKAEDNDEERRLLYVGMTRAQALLYLSYPTESSRSEETALSTFLEPLDGTRFLAACGPVFDYSVTRDLSKVLRRECPPEEFVVQSWDSVSQKLDDVWPLDGTKIPGTGQWGDDFANGRSFKRQKVDYDSFVDIRHQTTACGGDVMPTTMQTGFISAGTRHQEIEAERQTRPPSPIKHRSFERSNSAPQKRSKPAPAGQGDITNFFQKKSDPAYQGKYDYLKFKSPKSGTSRAPELPKPASFMTAKSVSSAFTPVCAPAAQPRPPPASNKIRRAPSYQRRNLDERTTSTHSHTSGLLSSSPAHSDAEGEARRDESNDTPIADGDDDENVAPISTLKPAVSFHQTSVSQVRATSAMPKKRYGVKPSFNGWANRHGGSKV